METREADGASSLGTTDLDLVTACLAGSNDAWAEIVHQHHQRIYNLAYRFTGRFDTAEDLTQEIFLKVYRSLHAYKREPAAFTTWLLRVARNHIIDHYRKSKTEQMRTDSLEVHHDAVELDVSQYPDPGQALERQEDSQRIHAALLRIPEHLREAVILRDLEELTYDEIAEMLRLPVGTVKSRINRGRIELAKLLRRG